MNDHRSSLRQAFYFLELAENAQTQFFGEEHRRRRGRLDADHENLRRALDTFHRQERVGRRAASRGRAMATLVCTRTSCGGTAAPRRMPSPQDGTRKTTAARVSGPPRRRAPRGSRQGDLDAAEGLPSRRGACARQLGDARGRRVRAQRRSGSRDSYTASRLCGAPSFRKAADLFHEAGERRGYAIALLNLGSRRDGPRPPCRVGAVGQRALEIFRELGDVSDRAPLYFGNLGLVALARGTIENAEEHLRESLRLALDECVTERIANALVGLAAVAASRGRVRRSRVATRCRRSHFETTPVMCRSARDRASRAPEASVRVGSGRRPVRRARRRSRDAPLGGRRSDLRLGPRG